MGDEVGTNEVIHEMIDDLDEWDNIKPALVEAVKRGMIEMHVYPGKYVNNIRDVAEVIKAYLENQKGKL